MTAPALSDFLLARYDEDEAAASNLLRYAQEHELACAEPQMLGKRIPGWHDWPKVQAMASHVLSDTDAKRRIVAAHPITDKVIPRGYTGPNDGFGCEVCHDWDGMTEGLGYCDTLRLLALPYAEHVDYLGWWRP